MGSVHVGGQSTCAVSDLVSEVEGSDFAGEGQVDLLTECKTWITALKIARGSS